MVAWIFAAGAAAAGVLSHVLYFNKGEHHMYGITYLLTFITAFAGSVTALVQLYGSSITSALASTSAISSSYLTGLTISLLIYRIWLSPLVKFPGPFVARITGLWLTVHAINSDLYLKSEVLHKKYGKYVRTGPSNLSVADADVYEPAYDFRKPWAKADWYDAAKPFDSMHTTRDKASHDRRRKVWAGAFSDKALREYEVKVQMFNDKLVERVKEFSGGPMNASKWFNLYSFDVMGQLAFGKNYGMLDSGDLHWAIEMLNEGMEATPPRVPVWIVRMLVATPNEVATKIFTFLKFCKGELEWRVNNKNADGDITGWILQAYKDWKGSPAEDPWFQGDSRLIIVAGSDTTAATMSFLFYHLASDPEEVKKLRAELRPLAKGDWSDVDIKHAPRLNGAINEALRLHPPVPSGVERKTPTGGVQIGDTYLPGDVPFWMPSYTIGRSEEYYERALDFVPERWYSKPDMIKHKNAFAPFSLGSQGCIGKNLALMELRTLTTQLLLNFDVALAPGEDGHRLLYETRDHFTLGLAGLDLVFTPVASRE